MLWLTFKHQTFPTDRYTEVFKLTKTQRNLLLIIIQIH